MAGVCLRPFDPVLDHQPCIADKGGECKDCSYYQSLDFGTGEERLPPPPFGDVQRKEERYLLELVALKCRSFAEAEVLLSKACEDDAVSPLAYAQLTSMVEDLFL